MMGNSFIHETVTQRFSSSTSFRSFAPLPSLSPCPILIFTTPLTLKSVRPAKPFLSSVPRIHKSHKSKSEIPRIQNVLRKETFCNGSSTRYARFVMLSWLENWESLGILLAFPQSDVKDGDALVRSQRPMIISIFQCMLSLDRKLLGVILYHTISHHIKLPSITFTSMRVRNPW